MHLFTATGFHGTIRDKCEEGVLEWIPKKHLLSLPMWEGDRIFLHLLDEEVPFFSLKLVYDRHGHLLHARLDGNELTI